MSATQPFDNRWWKLRRLGGALSRFLSPAHKRQLYKVSLWACGLSALEMFVAAAVIPYVGCLSGQCPAVIETTLQRLGWSEVPTLSLALFSLICLKLVVQALLAWSGARFNQQVQRDTVSRLLESYLHLDWKGFSSESRTHYFRRCATTAVDAAYVSQQCITMISSLLMLVFLVIAKNIARSRTGRTDPGAPHAACAPAPAPTARRSAPGWWGKPCRPQSRRRAAR